MSGPSPIIIDFIVRGVDDVKKAMKSITDTVMKIEQQSTTAVKTGTSERLKEKQREVREAAKSYAQTSQLADAAERAGTASVSRELRTRLSNQARHLLAVRKAEEQEAARVNGIRERSASMAGRYAAEQAARVNAIRERSAAMAGRYAAKQAAEELSIAKRVALEEKKIRLEMLRGEGKSASPGFSAQAQLIALRSAKGKSPEEQLKAIDHVQEMRARGKAANKQAEDERKKREAEERKLTETVEREEKRRQAIRERSAREEAREKEKAKREAEKETEEKRERFAKTVVGGASKGVQTATTIAGAVTRSALDLGGGFSVQNALQDRLSLERGASLLSVAARTPDQPERIDPKRIVERVKASSIATGTDANELLEGLNSYVAKSADYKGGEKNLDFFSKVAKSTGASVKDVMRTAGTLRVQNKNLDDKSMRELVLSTVMQARQGSVEFDDMAKAGGKVTRSAAAYTGSQADNQRKLLGLSQIGMRTAGNDVAEAATNLANIESDATKHSGAVERLLGRKFKDDKGRIVGGPDQFIGDLVVAAMGKKGGLQNLDLEDGNGKAFFGQRSRKMFQALAPVYNAAEEEALKKGATKEEAKKAGAAAVRKDISTTIATKYDEKDLEKDFSEIMKSSAEQFEQAVRMIKTDVADVLLPPMKQFAEALRENLPQIRRFLNGMGELASWATRNPLAASVAVLGGSIVREVMGQIISAKIGDVIKRLLSGGGGPTPPGGGGGGGGFGGAVAGTALAAGAIGVNAMLGYEGGVEGARDIRAKVDAWQRGDHERGVSPEKAKELLDQAQGRLKKTNAFEQAANLATSPFVEASNRDYKQYKSDQGLVESDEGKALMKQLIEVTQQNIETTKQNTDATRTNSEAGGGRVREPTGFNRGPGPITNRSSQGL